jgi:hypothetical protein
MNHAECSLNHAECSLNHAECSLNHRRLPLPAVGLAADCSPSCSRPPPLPCRRWATLSLSLSVSLSLSL